MVKLPKVLQTLVGRSQVGFAYVSLFYFFKFLLFLLVGLVRLLLVLNIKPFFVADIVEIFDTITKSCNPGTTSSS